MTPRVAVGLLFALLMVGGSHCAAMREGAAAQARSKSKLFDIYNGYGSIHGGTVGIRDQVVLLLSRCSTRYEDKTADEIVSTLREDAARGQSQGLLSWGFSMVRGVVRFVWSFGAINSILDDITVSNEALLQLHEQCLAIDVDGDDVRENYDKINQVVKEARDQVKQAETEAKQGDTGSSEPPAPDAAPGKDDVMRRLMEQVGARGSEGEARLQQCLAEKTELQARLEACERERIKNNLARDVRGPGSKALLWAEAEEHYADFVNILTSLESSADSTNAAEIKEGNMIKSEYAGLNRVRARATSAGLETIIRKMKVFNMNAGSKFRIFVKVYRQDVSGAEPGDVSTINTDSLKGEVEVRSPVTDKSRDFRGFYKVLDNQAGFEQADRATKAELGEEQNEEIKTDLEPWLGTVAEGANSVVLVAYGNTGSGKTFALFGDEAKLSSQGSQGIVNQAMQFIGEVKPGPDKAEISVTAFQMTGRVKTTGTETKVETLYTAAEGEAGALEHRGWADVDDSDKIVGDMIQYGAFSRAGSRARQFVLKASGKKTALTPLKFFDFDPESDASKRTLSEFAQRRFTKPTSLNENSSRSHMIMLFRVKAAGRSTPRYVVVIDLAGLEHFQAADDRQEETAYISSCFSDMYRAMSQSILKYGPRHGFGSSRELTGPAQFLKEFYVKEVYGDSAEGDFSKVKIAIVGSVTNKYQYDLNVRVVDRLHEWVQANMAKLENQYMLDKKIKGRLFAPPSFALPAGDSEAPGDDDEVPPRIDEPVDVYGGGLDL